MIFSASIEALENRTLLSSPLPPEATTLLPPIKDAHAGGIELSDGRILVSAGWKDAEDPAGRFLFTDPLQALNVGHYAADPVTSGYYATGSDRLIRYQANGDVDRSFGVDGAAHHPDSQLRFSQLHITATAIYAFSGDRVQMFDRKGARVAGFGQGGVVAVEHGVDGGGWSPIVSDVGLWTLDDGRIVTLTQVTAFDQQANRRLGSSLVVHRLMPDGRPDPSLGPGGRRIIPLAPKDGINDAIRHGEGFLIAGSMDGEGRLVRFDEDGSIDASFGMAGSVMLDDSRPTHVSLDGGGRIVAAHGGGIARFTASGEEAGRFRLTPDRRAAAAFPQPDGSIVTIGHLNEWTYDDGYVTVSEFYSVDGRLRTTFAPAGNATETLIQFEDFDHGGAGLAFREVDAVFAPTDHRPTSVDLASTQDVGGGFALTGTRPGEWLEFTLDVAQSDVYRLDLRVAAQGAGGRFHVEVNGHDVTGPVVVPDGGGWQNFGTISRANVPLDAGRRIVRVVMDQAGSGGFVGNFNWLRFTTQQQQTPFYGGPATLPGIIQAENFDNGGAGVAYHDLDAENKGGQYRATPVDVMPTNDLGAFYHVGAARGGEWLEYTVESPTENTYDLVVRAMNTHRGGSFHVDVDGRTVGGRVYVPAGATWQNLRVGDVTLAKGTHVVRLVFDYAALNGTAGYFNWIDFIAHRTPFAGAPAVVPGTVQAEDFDRGSLAHAEATPAVNTLYRETPVDLGRDADGTVFLTGMTAGEYVIYTVEKQTTRSTELLARVRSNGPGGRFHIEVDGRGVSGPVPIPDTAGQWQTISLGQVVLDAGAHALRIVVDGNNPAGGSAGDIDWVRFVKDVAGDVDPSFGDGGVLRPTDGAVLKATLADGSLLFHEGEDLRRYFHGGGVDPTFGGGNGRLSVGLYIGNVHELPDGRFLVPAGTGLAAFEPDGTPDAGFGSGGVLDTRGVYPHDFIALPDGRLIGVGTAGVPGARVTLAAVAFFPADGRLDPAFGDGGRSVADRVSIDNLFSGAVLMPDGSISVIGAGITEDHSEYNRPFILHYTLYPTGQWGTAQSEWLFPFDDTPGERTKGNTSIVLTPGGRVAFINLDTHTLRGLDRPIPVDPGASELFMQPDGKFLLVGEREEGVFVQRLLPDGAIDRTFGDDGEVLLSYAARDALLSVRFTGDRLILGIRSTDDPDVWRYDDEGWETRYVSIRLGASAA